jgi:hypothetical protein
MTAKRPERIAELLDDALQHTTANYLGVYSGNPDLCCGCDAARPVEGRSWCAACLPDEPERRSDDA